jgi:regulator of RNase E activity RraA
MGDTLSVIIIVGRLIKHDGLICDMIKNFKRNNMNLTNSTKKIKKAKRKQVCGKITQILSEHSDNIILILCIIYALNTGDVSVIDIQQLISVLVRLVKYINKIK